MSADELTRLLDELGKRLGPTGSHVFELAVRQVYVNAGTAIVFAVVVLGLGLVYGPRVRRWVDADTNSYSDRELPAMFLGIGYAVAVIIAAIFVVYAVPGVLNPEYAALANLLDHLR